MNRATQRVCEWFQRSGDGLFSEDDIRFLSRRLEPPHKKFMTSSKIGKKLGSLTRKRYCESPKFAETISIRFKLESLPPKTFGMKDLPSMGASLGGFRWLPRLMAKAHAKLRGEMPPELMYGCGGDRPFLKQLGIHPADFLKAGLAS